MVNLLFTPINLFLLGVLGLIIVFGALGLHSRHR